MKTGLRLQRALVLAAALAVLTPLVAAHAEKPPAIISGFVTSGGGVRIHYIEAGKGRAILFVPGFTAPGWMWQKQITHFAKTHRVVAMDPRAQGESSQTAEGLYPAARAGDIKAVVDQLKLAPVVLVGHSMGAAEVAAYVDQFGTDTLAALVFVDGWPDATTTRTLSRICSNGCLAFRKTDASGQKISFDQAICSRSHNRKTT